MKNNFFKKMIIAASVFALTACGGLGLFTGDFADYKESIKGKVVTKLVYEDDKSTEEDESEKSLDVGWFRRKETLFEYDDKNELTLTQLYTQGKLEDGYEVKLSVDDEVQSHAIVDVKHNKEKEKIFKDQNTPAQVFTVDAYVFDRTYDLYYHVAAKNEETILYEVNTDECVDIIGKTYELYFTTFYDSLMHLYDDVLMFADINNLVAPTDATTSDAIFGSLEWDSLNHKYIKYKTPVDEELGERLFMDAELTPFEQLNIGSIVNNYWPKALFFKSVLIYDSLGTKLMEHYFDIKEWNGKDSVYLPDIEDKLAPDELPTSSESSK